MNVLTLIKVSGQNLDELADAITHYDDITADNNTVYISFGNNLIMGEYVVYMIRKGFTPTYLIDNNDLLFHRIKRS